MLIRVAQNSHVPGTSQDLLVPVSKKESHLKRSLGYDVAHKTPGNDVHLFEEYDTQGFKMLLILQDFLSMFIFQHRLFFLIHSAKVREFLLMLLFELLNLT